MRISYLFSKNSKMGSKIISWGSSFDTQLKDVPSHVALLLNEKLVVESTFSSGVRIIPYKNWKEINQELYKIPCEQPVRNSTEIVSEIARMWGRPYDWKGIIYFTLCIIKLILFKTPLPKKNKWQRPGHFFCTELVGRVAGIEYEMLTPAKMAENMLESK